MPNERITVTEYCVSITFPKSDHEGFGRGCAQFTPEMNQQIGRAIKEAATTTLDRYIKEGRLDGHFRADMLP
jgi:hypothetical protein